MTAGYHVNGVDLHARLYGERGTPFVYVHGGFASLGRWLHGRTSCSAEWHRTFTSEFRLLAYDRRGCEHSSVPDAGYEPANQARDLVELLAALSFTGVHLFASSAGGPIAIIAAAEHPELIRSLTLQGTARVLLRPGDGVCDAVREAYDVLAAEGAEVAFTRRRPGVEVWFESAWGRRQADADGRLPEFLDEERDLVTRAAQLPADVRIERYAAELRNLHAYDGIDVATWAAAVSAPTLVLHGTEDRIFPPQEGRALAELIPGARFELIGGAGHGPVFTHRAARDRMRQFLSSHDQSPSSPVSGRTSTKGRS